MDEYETRPWTVEVSGLVQKPKTYDLDDIMKMQLEERLYRHRCVEAWFMDVPWIGVPLHQLFSSNVNPKVPHPRWSQASERSIDGSRGRKTRLFNGYADWVGHLY